MMNVLIDNLDLKTTYGIQVLDYTEVFGFPAERENQMEWADKSGVDKNLSNVRYDPKEFVLKCICKANNEALAYSLVNTLVEYMFSVGVFVLSLRNPSKGIRECFACERSATIVGILNIRYYNSLYHFKLGLRDINPNAIKYKTSIIGNSVTINYTKGQNGVIYWGNGERGEVSNSGNYQHTYAEASGNVDVIIDVDKTEADIISLVAEFTANTTSGSKSQEVIFADLSTGDPVIWSWNFGDGFTSSEQNPHHTYSQVGVFTVKLTIYNAQSGQAIEEKTDYITIRAARGLLNDSGNDFGIINDGNAYGLINE